MFPICCCCFKAEDILLSIKTKSSHDDGKMLLDYFNSVFPEFSKEPDVFDFICTRCSKALQVAYHFINMVKESKERRNEEIVLNNFTFKEEQHQIQVKQNSPPTFKSKAAQNNLNNESQLKRRRTSMSDLSSNKFLPLKLPKLFETYKHDLNTDAGPSVNAKKYEINLKCNICFILFENKHSFSEHIRQTHKEIVPYKCKLCSFYTCYTETLFKHCEKKHGLHNVALDSYQTKQVSKVVEDSPKFGITFVCISCNFKGCSQTSIEEHLSKVHSIDEDKDSFFNEYFDCPLCYRSFMTRKSVKIHYSMCHNCSFKGNNACNKRQFDCEKCGKSFDLKSGLFLHRRVCERRAAVKCNFCELQFTSVLKYERHLQGNHYVAIKHECEICSKTFNCSEYLAVHRKRHNERYHQCDLCSKNYISNADLKVHKQRIHGKKFANLSLLKYHENKEHNNNFFKCGYCDFASQSRSIITIHKYNHTGKPYKCKFCPKEFIFRKALRHHLEKHHSNILTDDETDELFKQTYDYTSHLDVFSEQNNILEIIDINELKLEGEIQEFGLTLEDIIKDLYNSETDNKKLP